MNNTFNFKRFLFLFRKTIYERPAQVFGIVGLNLIVVLLMYAFLRDIIGWPGTQNLTFIWGLVFGGCYLSAAIFSNFSSNARGSSYLTLPASNLEKWLCGVLLTWVIYVLIFLFYYKGMDAAFVSYYHMHLNPLEVDFQDKIEAVQQFDYGGHVARVAYLVFGNLTASMFVGSFYFNRNSFIKTGLIICCVFVLFYVVNLLIARSVFSHVNDAFPFSHVAIGLPSKNTVNEAFLAVRPKFEEGDISLPSPYVDIFRATIRYVLTGILCITALIRLKEKEF